MLRQIAMGHRARGPWLAVLSVLGLLVALPAWGGGGWSKTAADYLYPPPVHCPLDRVDSRPIGPVCAGEPVSPPSAPPRIHDSGEKSLEVTALPNELQVNILANLPIRDLLVCKQVCKHWQTLVTTVPALACAAYRSCHPAGYAPTLSDTVKSYHGSLRQWLNSFSEQGRQAVTQLDGILATDGPHFPEQLFFATARVLDEAPALHCRKVYTIRHSDWVGGTCFSPNEQYFVNHSGQTVNICHLVNGRWQEVATLPQPGQIICAYFSPDSKYLVVRLEHFHSIIWVFTDGQWQQQGNWPDPTVIGAFPRFNADATYVVTTSIDNIIKIYSAIDGQWQRQVTALDDYSVQGARFHPQEPDLLATYCQNTVTLWRSVAGLWQQEGTLVHPHRVFSIGFSPDGNRLVAHSGIPDRAALAADIHLHIWRRVGKEWGTEAARLPGAGYTARFSPRSNYILTTTDLYQGNMGLWRLSHGQWQDIKSSLNKSMCGGDFSPDQCYLAIQNWTYSVVILRCMDGLFQEETIIPYSPPFRHISFSPHSNHLVTAKDNNTTMIWGVYAGSWQEKATISHTSELKSNYFSPQGHYILTTTRDGTVTIWSLNSQQ